MLFNPKSALEIVAQRYAENKLSNAKFLCNSRKRDYNLCYEVFYCVDANSTIKKNIEVEKKTNFSGLIQSKKCI